MSDREATVDVVVIDATDQGDFWLEGVQACGTIGVAGNTPIPVRHLPCHDLPGPGPEQPAPAVALGDLGPLVLRDHALDLGEQTSLGIVVKGRCVGEEDPHAEVFKLIEDQHLIGVGAGQPIGRKAPHGIEGAGFGLIS